MGDAARIFSLIYATWDSPPFGTSDIRRAIKAGYYALDDTDVETTWAIMVWMMVGALCDIVAGHYPAKHEKYVVEMITRVAGASSEVARPWWQTHFPVILRRKSISPLI